RFIAPAAASEPAAAPALPPVAPATRPPTIFGRDGALQALAERLRRASEGERQVVFVTGPAAIGKTVLVEAFLATAAPAPGAWTARGPCPEQCGPGEAYLPVLDAIPRLCRERGSERIVPLLRRHAPTWLVQLTSLSGAEEREKLQRETLGATRERMLREVVEALEALAAEQAPLAIVLEDLHWSDFATLDILSLLARRRERADVLVIATSPPVGA